MNNISDLFNLENISMKRIIKNMLCTIIFELEGLQVCQHSSLEFSSFVQVREEQSFSYREYVYRRVLGAF